MAFHPLECCFLEFRGIFEVAGKEEYQMAVLEEFSCFLPRGS